ncbi:MAG: hypothetical protein IT385_08510 [Deltaproteobacteria bacterium]|nr:hypothetical protein [Deltaproteobacteria bacterium]
MRRVGVVALVALALVACGRGPAEPEPAAGGDEAPAIVRPRPEAAAAEQRLGVGLARLAGRERAGVYQRCPPADERFEAAMATLVEAGSRCRAARDEPAACDDFVKALLGKPPETIGCLYQPVPKPDEAREPSLDRPSLDVWAGLRVAIARARTRAAAGQVEDAARLVARAVRVGVLLLRSDDDLSWAAADEIAGWAPLLAAWAEGLPEEVATAVRADLEAARGAWLDLDFGLRASLLRDADRGKAAGGVDGGAMEEAALVTLEALAEGADLATLEAELDAAVRASDAEIRQVGARHGAMDQLTPRERGLLLTVVRRDLVRGLGRIAQAHQRASAAMDALPR